MHDETPIGPHRPRTRGYPRRAVLSAAALAATGAVLAACGSEPAPTAAPAPTAPRPTTAPATTAPPAAATAAATTAPTTAPAPATTASMTSAATASPGAMTAATTAPAVEGRIASPFAGVPDAYTKRPVPFKTVNTPPGRGGKVTYFNVSFGAPVAGRNDNLYWQELEKRLGVAIEPTFSPSGNAYNEKFAALAAGDSLPDINFLVGPSADQLRAINQGAFTDLTPSLTGSALQEFPNLARYPERLWKTSAIRGKIYGVPRPLSFVGNPLHWRADWAKKFGNPKPKNADEFQDLMVKFTKNDPDGNGAQDSWGLGSSGSAGRDVFTFSWIQQMFRTPNEWRKNPDGTLTHAYETEEFRQAVAYTRRLHDAGVFHPDTATMTQAQADQLRLGNKIGAYASGIFSYVGPTKAWETLARREPNRTDIVDYYGYLAPPAFDGGQRVSHNTPGFFGIAAIPAKVGRDRERVRELLRVINYYAAPFGSEEWVFMNYGLPGVHHEVTASGELAQNDRAKGEIGDMWHLASGERVYYQPAPAGAAQFILDFSKEMLEVGVDDPTWGLSSPTNAMKTGELSRFVADRLTNFIVGREPLTGIDTFVRDWRSRGGDMIRKEFEAGLKGQ